MRTFTVFILLLLFSSVSNGQSKVDLDRARKMVAEKKYFSALQIVSPCLSVKNSGEISNLDDCLYFGEEIAIKAVADMSVKYNASIAEIRKLDKPYDHDNYVNKKNEIESQLVKPFLDLGVSPFYSEIGGDWTYNHEFFTTLNNQLPNSKYREEVEYVLFSSSPSAVTSHWELWVSGLERYIKRHPTGKFSLRAKLDLARLYDDLWYIANPAYADDAKKDLMAMQNVYVDQNSVLANEYRKKALKLYGEIISDKDKSSLSPQNISEVKKRLIDLPKGISNNTVMLDRGD